MSRVLCVIPEYKGEDGSWHPINLNKDSDIWYQGMMRDCLNDRGKEIREFNEEELNLLTGSCSNTYTYKDYESGELKERTDTYNYDYRDRMKVITLNELCLEAYKQKSVTQKYFDKLLNDVENAVKSLEFAKVIQVSKSKSSIPDSYYEAVYNTKNDLTDAMFENEYGDNYEYMALSTHITVLQSFGKLVGRNLNNELRYLFYID